MEATTTRTAWAAAATANAVAADALRVARHFFEQFGDRFTRAFADELAHESAYEAWRRRTTLRRRECWEAFVRTVSRRRRWRALEAHLRVPLESLDADRRLQEQLVAEPTVPPCVRIAGKRVPVEWCAGEMDSVLRQLGSLNRCLVRGFYEGFSCVELAHRYSLPEDSVKVRLHRCRDRIRLELENRVRRRGAKVWGP